MHDEREAIRRVLDGDTEAFAALVERYRGPVFSLMLRATGDGALAEDLAQDAFLRAFEKLHTFKSGKRFFSWLYAIGMNVARDELRRRSHREVSAGDRLGSLADTRGGDDAQADMAERLDGQRAERAVLDLPLDYREALLLRFREDMSMKEIAEALGLSVSGAKMRVHRGLDMLRKRLGGDRP